MRLPESRRFVAQMSQINCPELGPPEPKLLRRCLDKQASAYFFSSSAFLISSAPSQPVEASTLGKAAFSPLSDSNPLSVIFAMR